MIKKEIVDGFCCCIHNMAFAISFCTIFAPPVCRRPLHFSVTPSIQSGRAKFLFLFWKGGGGEICIFL